ncbi:MAG TPA: MFS transporter [Candidatus Limnocylindrales bacterium]
MGTSAVIDTAVQEEVEGARPTALLPASHLLRISAYWLGLTAIDSGVNIAVQNRIVFERTLVPDPLMTGTAAALVGLAGAIIAIIVQPTVGYLSDFTVSRWGRRKPYIVVGSLLDVVFLLGIAYSNTLLALGAFIALLSVSTNVARGPFQGYVPDLVAEPQVGTASALVGMMQVVGNVVGTLIATYAAQSGNIPAGLAAIALIELVTMSSVVLRVGKGMPPRPRNGRTWTRIARETWSADILRERSYVWLLVSRFLFLTAGGIMFNLAIKYMAEVQHMSQDDANGAVRIASILIVVAIVLVSVPAGRLSDRVGRKPVIYMACGIGVVAMATMALAPSVQVAYLGALLYGIGGGVFVAVDWALMTDIIPRASSGRYMGLSNVATGASSPVSVAVGGVLADLINRVVVMGAGMRASLIVALGLYLLAAWALRPVVEPRRSRAVPAASAA